MYLLAFAGLTILLGRWLIPWLGKQQLGQQIREDGPKSHLKKMGTPTMGGLLFVPLLIVYSLLIAALDYPRFFPEMLVVALSLFLFGLIGFLDDYIGVRIRKEGFSVRQKSIFLLLACLPIVGYLMCQPSLTLYFPFLGAWTLPIWARILYGLFLLVYFFYCVNAVNLTDGIDGLASSLGIVVALALAYAAILTQALPSYLLALGLVGLLIGFLFFNRHPAKVFMGDTGSLPLGFLLSLLPVLMGLPWFFPLAGLIFVWEGLSVVIQVLYFKKTGGKRIFRMSPYHHHLELGGWKEGRIVLLFVALTLILSLLACFLLTSVNLTEVKTTAQAALACWGLQA